MNYQVLPQTTVAGRITNPLRLHKNKQGKVFVQVLLYLYHAGIARLMPTVAFGQTAKKMVAIAQQGDLIDTHDAIDPIQHGQLINQVLVVQAFSFLEPKTMRRIYHGKQGKQLEVLFPVVPSNFHYTKGAQRASARRSVKAPKSSKRSSNKKKIPVVTGTIEHPRHADVHVRKTQPKAKQSFKNAGHQPDDWMDEAINLSNQML